MEANDRITWYQETTGLEVYDSEEEDDFFDDTDEDETDETESDNKILRRIPE